MLTENGNGGGELSVSEQGLAVDLCVRVVRVGVTRGSFHPRPLANGAVPSYDAVQNTAVVLQEQRHDHIDQTPSGWTPTGLGGSGFSSHFL